MAKPLQHVAIAIVAIKVAKQAGLDPREKAFIIGNILPDLDFLIFVPIMGRAKGHRTITHSPIFQIFLALVFHKFGFWSLLSGMLLHSFVDAGAFVKPSTGIAWFWPFKWERF